MQKICLDKSWEYLESRLNNLMLIQHLPGWKPVDIPHDAALEKERKEDNPSGPEEGYTAGVSLYYKRELLVEKEWQGKNLILEFEGVMGIAEVFVNGTLVAKHFNGYTSFLVDITRYVKLGEKNIILVYVENTHKPSSRWYAGAGIYRHVWLHVGGSVYIKPWDLRVKTTSIKGTAATLQVTTTVTNSCSRPVDGVLKLQIFTQDHELILSEEKGFTMEANSAKEINVPLIIEPFKYWDIDEPYLYKVEASVIIDDVVEDCATTSTGIREISYDAREGFKLNGKPIKLKGGCIHHDNGPLGSASYDRAEERKVELLKASGFNAVRLAHNPHAPAFLDACDRLGMLVIEEFFDVWTAGKRSFDYHIFFEKYWEEDLEATIRRDFNHPSIIMWSIGNEITWSVGNEMPDGNGAYDLHAWYRRLADKVRELDSTRPVTAAVCSLMFEYSDMVSIEDGDVVVNILNKEVDLNNDKWGEVTEKFFEPLDVAGYNYKVKRYKHDAVKYPNRVICGTETYPYTLFENWIETIKNPNVIGDFVWTAIDYLGEAGIGRVSVDREDRMPCGNFPWFYANCGDIDICGEKRPQSYYRDVVWGNRENPYIAVLPPSMYGKKLYLKPWSWEPVEHSYTFPGYEGQKTKVWVYSDADEVELFVNGRSVGRREAGVKAKYKVTFDIVYEPGMLEAVAYKNGKETGRDKIETTGEPVAIELRADRTTIRSEYGDLCYITITAVDEKGRVVPYADNKVVVEVTGSGELIALGNADPLSTELFIGKERKLYKGRALAVVRSTGERGKFILEAKSEGLISKEIIIQCK